MVISEKAGNLFQPNPDWQKSLYVDIGLNKLLENVCLHKQI